uniref:NADH-ubiquinone oxidoreductase chain 6 n=1 Tax=Amicula sp. isolate GU52X-4 cfCalB7 TaxID=3003489 RepID=A0A9E9C5S0_9STRA|nr:NADH dehydrogenase subunit 6 [Amicula sp. isolate GU52X-4 cfCalB7]
MKTNVLFYLFSLFLVICYFMVIIAQHPVFSLLFLVSSFLFSSFLLFIVECEFLALIFIVIYVGAIAVLFLFAIMMLESKLNNLSKNLIKYLPVVSFFSIVLLFSLLYEFFINFEINSYVYVNDFKLYSIEYQNWYQLNDYLIDIEIYGKILYTWFILQFLISGLILLLVLIGIVCLNSSFTNPQLRNQVIFKQLSKNFKVVL